METYTLENPPITQNSKIVIWTTNKYFDQYYEHVSVHTKFGSIQVCARFDLGWPHPALVLPVYRLGRFIFSQTFHRELHTCIGSFHVSVHTSLGYESLCNLSIRSRAATTSTGAPCKHRLAVIFSLTHVCVYTYCKPEGRWKTTHKATCLLHRGDTI